MSQIRTGISGWTYAPWRGVFYPRKLPLSQELAYASRQVDTIEINGSFYALQRPASYLKWHSATPEGFVFALKGPRFITHMRRLIGVEEPLANFFASGVLALGEKLGPVLWQLPPRMRFDPERISRFLELLPDSSSAALRLARKHGRWMRGRVFLEDGGERRIRHTIEPRHESFSDPRFARLLDDYGVALTVSHSSGHWPIFEEMTADFVYVRLHGEGKLYAGGYGSRALGDWAAKIRRWTSYGRDAYIYFDNDVKVRAPADAIALARLLAEPVAETRRAA